MKSIMIILVLAASLLLAETQHMRTLEALQQHDNFVFRETKLSSVVSSLGRAMNTTIHFDESLRNKTVTLVEQDISFQQALSFILTPFDFTFTIQKDGSLTIVHAQMLSTIKGRIRFADSGEPVPAANVFLQGTGFGSSTNQQGEFIVKNIPPSIYTLRIRLIGYKPLAYTLDLQNGKVMNLEFELEPDVLQMQEIVATATREQHVISPEISSFSMRARQISMMPSYGEHDVFQSLQMLPGVITTNEFKSQLYIRGGNSDQNLIMLDGGVMYNPFHFSGILSAFDVDAVDQVDFYAGGFSAEYGGRLSSVVNIHTRTGAQKWKNQLGVSPLSVKFLTEAPLWKWGNILLTARRSYVSYAAEQMGGAVQPEFYDGIGNLTIRPSQHDTITVSAFYGNDVVKLQKTSDVDVMTSNNFTSSLNYHRDFANRVFLDFKTSFGEFDTSQPQTLSENEAQHNRLKDVNSALKLRFQISGTFNLLAGADYRETDMFYKSADPIVAEKKIDRIVKEKAGFVQTRWRPAPWAFDVGVRATQYENQGETVFEPRVSISYDVFNFLSVNAAYGHYSQNLVTIYNENDTYNPVDIWLPPDPDLQLAKARHYILGVNFHTTNTLLSVETYYRNYKNLTQYNRERLYPEDPFFIQGYGESYGLDITAQYFTPRWQVWGSYSLAKAEKTLPFYFPEPGWDTFAPRYDRRHNLNIAFEYKVMDRLIFTSRFSLGSGLPFSFMIGAYKRWSAFVINAPSDWFAGPDALDDYYLTAIMSERDAFRYPTYHRLDVALKYSIRWSKLKIDPYAQIINLYNQPNVLYYDIYAQPHTTVPFLPMAGVDIYF